MNFDMWINGGETITIDLSPGIKSVVSSWGRQLVGQPLPGSEKSEFVLESEYNEISVLILDDTVATQAAIAFVPLFWGFESGDVA